MVCVTGTRPDGTLHMNDCGGGVKVAVLTKEGLDLTRGPPRTAEEVLNQWEFRPQSLCDEIAGLMSTKGPEVAKAHFEWLMQERDAVDSVNPLALREIDLERDTVEEYPDVPNTRLPGNLLWSTSHQPGFMQEQKPATAVNCADDNEKSSKLKLGLSTIAFMLSENEMALRGTDSSHFKPFTAKGAPKKTEQFFTAEMHYNPLVPLEDDKIIEFEKISSGITAPELYFVPSKSLSPAHKNTYHVFSSDKKFCLAIHGGMYERTREIVPTLLSVRDQPIQVQSGTDSVLSNIRFHYCALYVNQNWKEDAKGDENDLKKAKWELAKLENLIDEPLLPAGLKNELNKREDDLEKKKFMYLKGPTIIVKDLFRDKMDVIYEAVKSLSARNQKWNTGAVISETPEDKSIVLPTFSTRDVNRVVTIESMKTIITALQNKGCTVTLPYNERSDVVKVEKKEWDILAGCDNVVKNLKDVLRNATQVADANLVMNINKAISGKAKHTFPNALLFTGPPGTGKTLCAKILADQGGIPMINVCSSEIFDKYVGNSERNLKDVFTLIRRLGEIRGETTVGPSSILFMDEIDSMTNSNQRNGHTSGVLTTFLEQLDGFKTANSFIFVACTNNKKGLDPAFVNRINLSIAFPAPKFESRKAIFKCKAHYLNDEELTKLAKIEGLTGRDIEAVVNDSVIQRKVELEEMAKEQNLDIVQFNEKYGSNYEVLRPTVDTFLKCINSRVSNSYEDHEGTALSTKYGGTIGSKEVGKKNASDPNDFQEMYKKMVGNNKPTPQAAPADNANAAPASDAAAAPTPAASDAGAPDATASDATAPVATASDATASDATDPVATASDSAAPVDKADATPDSDDSGYGSADDESN